MKQNVKTLFALLGNVLFGKEVDEEIKKETTEHALEIYKLSKFHDLSHLYSYAVVKNGITIEDEELFKILKKRHPIALLRYETANDEFCRLTDFFENEKIAFVPLKGAVMREYYPEKWMRTSCDIDVLVHEEDLDRAIELLTEKCSYTVNEKGTHDVSLFSHNGTHIELHFKLSEDYYDNNAGKLLLTAWDYAIQKEGKSFWHEFADEFFYLYHIYHMAKHFEVAGCGIKPFLDLYILDKQISHDEEKRNALLSKGGLRVFADSCRRLNECWFEGSEFDRTMTSMQAYIVTGGTYGNKSNGVAMRQTKSGGKIKYILERLFLPYDMLKVHYPVVEKRKYLTPVFEVIRWFRLLSPETFKNSSKEIMIGSNVPENKSEKLSDLLPKLGLK